MLYHLSLFNDRQEGFFIGLFESSEEARRVADHYLSAVPGFREYSCICEITEKTVIGTIGPARKVHMIWGWNEGVKGNETGIWSSDCYADYEDAQRALAIARLRMNKQAWSLDTYQIGQCHWTEGFVRIYESEQEISPQPDGQQMLL